ncbi:hypothetical protein [uncultured Gammaproteobacteria bacterium]|nr:hypothetical protein [uncultured Gammaproteobacteria bacterium]CAC9958813.1 hypothetical protein [uncultured Gammaproteobacteria bacterium]
MAINNEIKKNITKERIAVRASFLISIFNEIKTDRGLEDFVKINYAILHDVVYSYFIDAERHKFFHSIGAMKKYKISAYTTKWIIKLRPIYFDIDSPNDIDSTELILLNEIFALKVGLAISEIPVEVINPRLIDKATYTFHYRHTTEDMLSLWYKTLGSSSELEIYG